MDTEEQFNKLKEKFDKIDELTLDADLLTDALHEILKANEEKRGMGKLCYLSELIRKKFDEIRGVF